MASQRVRRPEPCNHENCGSRRFHVGDDGYTYCDRGHQQSERGTVVAEDTGELITVGRKTRRKDSDAESISSRVSGLSGTRAFEHYLLCLQLVLRKQLHWLIETQKLPEELETLVRDLWALRLQKLQHRVSYESETETEGQSQLFSSQSEAETTDTEATKRSRRSQSQVRLDGTPNLADLLALICTALLLLRESVTVADIHGWTSDGKLLYHYSSKEVPLGMRERLPANYQQLLEPQTLLKAERLHEAILEVLKLLGEDFGMAFPPINYTVVLYRWVRDLCLPIEVFAATQRLARLLETEFSYELNAKSRTRDVVLRYPEPRMMALVVVATKLLFPFDDVKRYATSSSSLAALALDWCGWASKVTRTQTDEAGANHLGYQKALTLSETEAVHAASDQLDQYMDWYEHTIATEDVRERGRAGNDADFRRTLFELFPVKGSPPAVTVTAEGAGVSEPDTAEKLRNVQALLRPRRIVEGRTGNSDVSRIGSHYRRYRSSEDLDGPAKTFYQRAAELAGLGLDDMVRAVFLVERRMQKYEERARKEGG